MHGDVHAAIEQLDPTRTHEIDERLYRLVEQLRRTQTYPRRFSVRSGSKHYFVRADDIDWIDAAGDYMCVHADGDTYVLRGTMKRLEELLDPELFVRVHRSTIVNRKRVRSLRPHRNGEYFLTLDNQRELKLSRSYKANLARLTN